MIRIRGRELGFVRSYFRSTIRLPGFADKKPCVYLCKPVNVKGGLNGFLRICNETYYGLTLQKRCWERGGPSIRTYLSTPQSIGEDKIRMLPFRTHLYIVRVTRRPRSCARFFAPGKYLEESWFRFHGFAISAKIRSHPQQDYLRSGKAIESLRLRLPRTGLRVALQWSISRLGFRHGAQQGTARETETAAAYFLSLIPKGPLPAGYKHVLGPDHRPLCGCPAIYTGASVLKSQTVVQPMRNCARYHPCCGPTYLKIPRTPESLSDIRQAPIS
ncbi:hypothetical protein BJ322DRAFT_367356 [Thelephora terrestris]|uniref:Uncharacterized protein n=1 Tax=Thelephora terrestris TaxID=56493 RepID=A0A9P6L1V6_9AGAM|nr:hypothetical protein BJ322DRAFT_367356 [Thelephora terrestris]